MRSPLGSELHGAQLWAAAGAGLSQRQIQCEAPIAAKAYDYLRIYCVRYPLPPNHSF